MATRLYPMTKDPVKLELLAGVPAGTHAKLTELEAKYGTNYDGLYGALYTVGNEDLLELNSFLLCGWGRLQCNVAQWGMDYVSGSTTDSGQVRCMLADQDVMTNNFRSIVVELCEGLCWS